VMGCSSDKDLDRIMGVLAPRCGALLAVQASVPRARDAAEVAEAAVAAGVPHVRTMPDPWEAMQLALGEAHADEIVCVTGSFYSAGEIRARWADAHPEAGA